MALQATHIKFALDLKDKYQPQSLKKYISGAIYPDSRYVTGLDRKLTHGEQLLSIDLTDDFKKGWHCHLICDKLLGLAIDKLLPDEFNAQKNIMQQGNQFWLKRTAVKILQEIDVFKSFNLQPYLSMLDYVENALGEDIDLVKKSNYLVQKNYHQKVEINLSNIMEIWRGLILSEEMLNKIKQTALELMQDKKMIFIIKELYPEMLKLANEYYKTHAITINK